MRPGQCGDRQGVGGDDLETIGEVGAALGDRVVEGAGEHVVDLDRHDARHVRKQCESQRAQTRTHLDDDVVLAELGHSHDPTHGVAVDDEVLTSLLRRPHSESFGELAYVGSAEKSVRGHARSLPRRRGTRGYQAPKADWAFS